MTTPLLTEFRMLCILFLSKKKNCKRQNGCLTRPYKLLRKEEKGKTKEKRKDIPI